MLIDTHCHLNFHAFKKDLPDVVRRAKQAGVESIIIPGTDLSSSRKAVEIAQTYPGCYAAVGIHPHHARDPNLVINDELRRQLEELITQNRPARRSSDKNQRVGGVVAVGEIGLDYFRYTKTKYEDNTITVEIKQKQKDLLELQIEVALIHNLPVIFHCREAYADMIQTISSFAPNFVQITLGKKATDDKSSTFAKATADKTFSRTRPPQNNYIKPVQLRGVFHCFSGSTQDLQLLLTMGYYVGFDGNITYSETQYTPLVAAAPLNKILLETDAPFLAPIPHRGTRNEPAYLPFVAQAVANYHHSPLSEVIHISTDNARALFELD